MFGSECSRKELEQALCASFEQALCASIEQASWTSLIASAVYNS